MTALRVALGEYDIGWEDPDTSLARAGEVLARAAAGGARLVVLPEMATTGFTMDTSHATPLAGGDSSRLAALAARHAVWLIAGVAARDADGAFNAAIVADPRGEIVAVYRKQRLFTFGGEHERYVPGERPVIVEIEGVRIAPFICYDLRFPELFRDVAPDVDAFVLVANWPAARRVHWEVLTRARAIENQAYFVAVNRTGSGGGLDFAGGSAAYDPWGEPLASPIVTLDPARVREIRERYPFLADRFGAPSARLIR